MTKSLFVPLGAEGYEYCYPVDEGDFENLNLQMNGDLRTARWCSPEMRLVREDQGRMLSESDAPWLGSHVLIFRRGALASLRTTLQSCGELLPCKCASADLEFFNASVIDGLDEAKSSALRFSNGKIMRITSYVFRPDAVADVHAFRIPNLRVSPIFVSDRFVELWKCHGLRGVDFQKVWSAPA